MNEKDFESLRKLFILIDVNGDGCISSHELRTYLHANNNSLMV